MDVDQPAAVAVDEIGGEHAHEAGEHHQIGVRGVDGLRQRGVESRAVGIGAMIDDGGRDALRCAMRRARAARARC